MDHKAIKKPELQPKEGVQKVPLLFRWAVKDLTNPITVKRVQLAQSLLLGLTFVAVSVWVYYGFVKGPTGVEVRAAMIDAAGGKVAWDGIKQGTFTRTQQLYEENGNELKKKVETFFFQKTDHGTKMMVNATNKDGKEIWVGQDDQGFWASENTKSVDPIAAAKDEGMMCDSKFCDPMCAATMAFYRFSMPFKLNDPGVIPQSNGTATLNQAEMNILDITYKPEVGKDKWVFYADQDDGLIRKMEYHNKSDNGHTRAEELYFSDHQTKDGITFAHTWTRYWSNGKVMEQYTYSNVDFSLDMAEDFFDRGTDRQLAGI
ncbi:MAG: DUF6503 family protein [Cyclobacteriaceae bacterium]